jgi:hypothetical protein
MYGGHTVVSRGGMVPHHTMSVRRFPIKLNQYGRQQIVFILAKAYFKCV